MIDPLLFCALGYISIMATFAVALYVSEPKPKVIPPTALCGGIGKKKPGGGRW